VLSLATVLCPFSCGSKFPFGLARILLFQSHADSHALKLILSPLTFDIPDFFAVQTRAIEELGPATFWDREPVGR
jgi:hypothetical protein